MRSVEFFADPRAFLSAAGPFLRAAPVVTSVLATVTQRCAEREERGDLPARDYPQWWAVVRDESGVVGAAMRTMPHPPYAAYVAPMPPHAAEALAHALAEASALDPAHPVALDHVNGAIDVAHAVLGEQALLRGGRILQEMATRLHGLGEVIVPPQPGGILRPATTADLDLVTDWLGRFHAEAAAQAGRVHTHDGALSRDECRDRLPTISLWAVDGEVVHLTAITPPAFGVCRVGPVYTPPEHRGRGYAAAAVAQVSATAKGAGHEVCLFTDLDNPTSNALYARLGFRPICDMANLTRLPFPA